MACDLKSGAFIVGRTYSQPVAKLISPRKSHAATHRPIPRSFCEGAAIGGEEYAGEKGESTEDRSISPAIRSIFESDQKELFISRPIYII
jgi:hypothetical protein